MLGWPGTTQFDLRFQALGIPVRVHPMFWLTAVLLGNPFQNDYRVVLIWVACVFVSILVHEFGHGLMARLLRFPASIVLYWMGGLCYSESERQRPRQRLLVLFAGPGAGFLLAGLIKGGLLLAHRPTLSPVGEIVVDFLYQINIFWSVLNLCPIWPLDGGQIAGVALTLHNSRKGMRRTHIVSIVFAVVLGLLMFWFGQTFTTLLFALFALSNFQMLQASHQYVEYGDEADWWKR